MTGTKMIEEFVCPGCVCGSDTNCGRFEESTGIGLGCSSHVLGTFSMTFGSMALGLPKGFNKAGFMPHAKDFSDKHGKMEIFCYSKDETVNYFDKLNIPVWALEKDGFLFVRAYSPRINKACVIVIEGGTLDMVPDAVNVSEFYDEID